MEKQTTKRETTEEQTKTRSGPAQQEPDQSIKDPSDGGGSKERKPSADKPETE